MLASILTVVCLLPGLIIVHAMRMLRAPKIPRARVHYDAHEAARARDARKRVHALAHGHNVRP